MKRKIIALLLLLVSLSLFGQSAGGSSAGESAVPVENTDGDAAGSEGTGETLPEDTEQTPVGAGETGSAQPQSQGPSLWLRIWNVLKAVFFFALVLTILFLLFRIMKKLGAGQLSSDDAIELVTTRQLAGSRYLHVVKVGGEYLLISSTDGGVSLLKELDDKETIDQLQIHKEKEASPDGLNFRDMLGNFIKPGAGSLSSGKKMRESLKNLEKQSDRLKKM